VIRKAALGYVARPLQKHAIVAVLMESLDKSRYTA
jgi:hypothetical protein